MYKSWVIIFKYEVYRKNCLKYNAFAKSTFVPCGGEAVWIHGTHISGSKIHIINGDLETSFLDFLVEPSKVAKGMIVR